jgi:hypothetical protein
MINQSIVGLKGTRSLIIKCPGSILQRANKVRLELILKEIWYLHWF